MQGNLSDILALGAGLLHTGVPYLDAYLLCNTNIQLLEHLGLNPDYLAA